MEHSFYLMNGSWFKLRFYQPKGTLRPEEWDSSLLPAPLEIHPGTTKRTRNGNKKLCILWTLETSVTPIHSMGTERTDDEEIVNDSLGYREIKLKCLQREILSVYSTECWKDSGIRGPCIIGWRRRTGLKTRRLLQGWSEKHVVPREPTLTTSFGITSFVSPQLNVLFFWIMESPEKQHRKGKK